MMMNDLTNQHIHFNLLHKILLIIIIAIGVIGLIMGLNRPFPLIVLALVYFILGCQRVSLFTYKILIVGLTTILAIDSLQILYLCFEEANIHIFFTHKVDSPLKGFISIGLQLFVVCYAMLICWRAYQRNKLYTILMNDFMMAG